MKQSAAAPTGAPAAVLHARALALAQCKQPAAPGSALELLEFRLAREHYAIETRHAGAVLPLGNLTPVPCTPAFIAGVVNVRGRVTAVIDIPRLFGLAPRGLVDLHHVILVRDAGLELGLLADAIVGVRACAREALQPALAAAAGVPAEYLLGMTAERVLVLDLPRMLAHPRMNVDEEVRP